MREPTGIGFPGRIPVITVKGPDQKNAATRAAWRGRSGVHRSSCNALCGAIRRK